MLGGAAGSSKIYAYRLRVPGSLLQAVINVNGRDSRGESESVISENIYHVHQRMMLLIYTIGMSKNENKSSLLSDSLE